MLNEVSALKNDRRASECPKPRDVRHATSLSEMRDLPVDGGMGKAVVNVNCVHHGKAPKFGSHAAHE
eukprot:2521542-Rhodomonas_salina.1